MITYIDRAVFRHVSWPQVIIDMVVITVTRESHKIAVCNDLAAEKYNITSVSERERSKHIRHASEPSEYIIQARKRVQYQDAAEASKHILAPPQLFLVGREHSLANGKR